MHVPKKSLGQHWLHDSNILDEIVKTAKLSPTDHVLEVGPGTGSLTQKLLATGVILIAIEKDNQLAASLISRISRISRVQPWKQNLTVVNQDILEFDLNNLPPKYKVVANIPYYLTSNLIRQFSESKNPPASITLLVQKEVAQRLCAQPGQMSLLSVSAQAYYQVSLGLVVRAAKFTPPPKVDSQIVYMTRRLAPAFGEVNPRSFFRVVKSGFSARRKTLLNSLSGGLGMPKDRTMEILQTCQINPAARPQDLTLYQWKELSKVLEPPSS
ncbi:16S rRNA (adenine(1518)-N(6)/adenine(1519)-N(6))-dimethyltransferase RsmA [Candidatus Parcubacteria bacterium]|nr:16S rRNA (adenine(1518)-N(6)/adenine(1519)-N(6))-dimethyltransferase RsmA [Candidatus Parcubacteria bacterium]